MKQLHFKKVFVLMFCFFACFYSVNVHAWEFIDVPDSHWACAEISNATQKRWFSGYNDGTFKPDEKITRAEATKVLVSFLNIEVLKKESTYLDVSNDAWYVNYVMAGRDLFPAYGQKNYFYPNEPVTREDVIYALMRGLNVGTNLSYVDISLAESVVDSKEISDIVKPYFAMALQTNFVSGYSDGTVRPKNELTRAEFTVFLARADKNLR